MAKKKKTLGTSLFKIPNGSIYGSGRGGYGGANFSGGASLFSQIASSKLFAPAPGLGSNAGAYRPTAGIGGSGAFGAMLPTTGGRGGYGGAGYSGGTSLFSQIASSKLVAPAAGIGSNAIKPFSNSGSLLGGDSILTRGVAPFSQTPSVSGNNVGFGYNLPADQITPPSIGGGRNPGAYYGNGVFPSTPNEILGGLNALGQTVYPGEQPWINAGAGLGTNVGVLSPAALAAAKEPKYGGYGDGIFSTDIFENIKQTFRAEKGRDAKRWWVGRGAGAGGNRHIKARFNNVVSPQYNGAISNYSINWRVGAG